MADQEYRDALFIGTDQRSNFKDVVAKRSELLRRDGGRLGASQNGVTLEAGTVLGYAATGGDAGHYKPYAVGNSDGSQVAVGVLEQQASPDANGNGSQISIIRHGCLLQALLIGLDSGAITNLKAISFVEHGTQMLEF
jgi:hypothetical protein